MSKIISLNGIKVGDKFTKPLSGLKFAECEVIDFHVTKSLSTGKVISESVVAKSKNYGMGLPFEVSFTTVKKGRTN